MSGNTKPAPLTLVDVLTKVGKVLEEQNKAVERRRAWEASLPPEERAARERQRAEEEWQREFSKFRRALGPFSTALGKRESWSIADFASLLTGLRPGAAPSILNLSSQEEMREEIRATLQSCVGTTLQPVSGNRQSSKALYGIHDLLALANTKSLGRHDLVAILANAQPQLPAPTPTLTATLATPAALIEASHSLPTLAEQGLAVRQAAVIERRNEQIRIARMFVAEGFGKERNQVIRLSVDSGPFNARLREHCPEYANVNERTLRIDRSQSCPAIVLRVGRPRIPTVEQSPGDL